MYKMSGNYRTYDIATSAFPNVNVKSTEYRALIGEREITENSEMESSEDFQNGALVNESEYLRRFLRKQINSLRLENATGDGLDLLIQEFIDLPRFTEFEEDDIYRNRFRAIAVQGSKHIWTTRAAIKAALQYFLPEGTSVQLFEPEQINGNPVLSIRFFREGSSAFDPVIIDQTAIDQANIGGILVNIPQSVLTIIIQRIKAAGVEVQVGATTVSSESFTSSANIET